MSVDVGVTVVGVAVDVGAVVVVNDTLIYLDGRILGAEHDSRAATIPQL